MPHSDRLNIAVFIDFDNIEIGVKSTLGEHFDAGTILDAIKERGEVVTKIAYADWTRAGEYSRALTQHAIRLVQRNMTPGGDKNGADINLALDALEMSFTHPHINAYVIVGGDSDFLSLVEKLKQYDKKVFVVGGRAFTSVILQRNCHEFIAYENLVSRRPSARAPGRPAAVSATAPVAQAFPLVRRALKILADREVTPQTGLLKSTLLQLDSTFSERNYGASSFLDFAEKLAQAGLVTLKHSGRSVVVELNDGFGEEDAGLKLRAPSEAEEPRLPAAAGPSDRPDEGRPDSLRQGFGGPPEPHAKAEGRPPEGRPPQEVQPTAGAAEGVQRAGRILAAATGARWPMYLRNVKQILRQHRGAPGSIDAGGFDERQYGFGGLMDLLKACQREGLVRIERDRRGGLRVFQGTALQKAHVPLQPLEVAEAPGRVSIGSMSITPGEVVVTPEPLESEQPEGEPIPIDTTAELLGRAKPKRAAGRGRTRLERPAPTAAPRKTAAKKPPARRSTRAKKQHAADETEG